MASINKVAGDKGCDLQIGAGTYVPAGRHAGKKIHAIGVQVGANITNFKYTPKVPIGTAQITVTADGWFGSVLAATGGSAFIPLGVSADEVVVASGDVWMYFE